MSDFEKNAFIFTSGTTSYGAMIPVLLDEIIEMPNVYLLNDTFSIRESIFKVLKKFFFSTIINLKLKEIPCKVGQFLLFRKYSMIKELDKLSKQYGQVNMVFFNPFIQRFYGLKVLQKIKKRYSNVNFILFFIDPTTIYAAEGAMNLLKADNTLFNQIYTVDEEDAKMYGFKYNLTPYSKIEMDEETKYDIYFCGATKNRQLLVIDIAKKFKNRVKTKWDLFYIKENEKNLDELKGLLDIKKISNMKVYRDTLKYVAQSNCILELITEEQSAKYTLRDYEAIVYGKKLLTNNKNIFDFPYYDSRYMKYFKSVEDIDVDWLKNREHVEYLFGNELFSPTKLLYRIMDNN